MTEIRFYKAPGKAIKLILQCSIFVGFGIFGLTTGAMPPLLSWLGIGFFGLGYPVGLFHLFDRRPQIIINEIGIFDRTAHEDFINWELIKGAYLIDIYKQKFICLVVDENFKPSRKKGKIYRAAAKMNEAIGAQELNVSLGQLKTNPEKMVAFIITLLKADKPLREDLIKKSLMMKGFGV